MDELLTEIVSCGERARANYEAGDNVCAEHLIRLMKTLTKTYVRLVRLEAEVADA